MTLPRLGFLVSFFLLATTSHGLARDAAFLEPGAGFVGGAAGGGAIAVEPQAEIDTGETALGVSRRQTVFFVNRTTLPVDVEKVTASGDGNVRSEIVSDDCTKLGKIETSNRCSVVVEVTPSGAGTWGSEVLMTHNGAGRMTRAKITGKTSGQASGDKKESGLAINAKDSKPVDFGDVPANSGKAVRSALMVNDSPEPITLLSIDLIAAENGLEKLDQGCALDMDLKPGESCPITMIWKPTMKGQISTDLIIRHSGRLGFAVIPVRGTSKTDAAALTDKDGKLIEGKEASGKGSSAARPDQGPSMAQDLAAIAANLPPLPGAALGEGAVAASQNAVAAQTEASTGTFHLIGTVGSRAVLLMPDGSTAVYGVGEDILFGSDKKAKISNVFPKSVEIFIEGKQKKLSLEAASALTRRAAEARAAEAQTTTTNATNKKTDNKSSDTTERR